MDSVHKFPASPQEVLDEPVAGKVRRFPALDGLRLFLAIEVLCQHMWGLQNVGHWILIVPAVPCFVCISGFLIPASFSRSRNWGHFAWKRFLRVGPAFAASLAMVAILMDPGLVAPTFSFYLRMGIGASFSVNEPLWSLMLEEVLYFFHALSRKLRGLYGQPLIWSALVGWTVFWFLSPRLHLPDGSDRAMAPVTSFLCGNLLYFHQDRVLRIPWFALAALAAAILLAPFPAPLSTPLASVLTLSAVLAMPFRWRLPDYSFGIYVYHMPILTTCQGDVPSTFFWTFASAAVSWHFLESKFLLLKDWQPLIPRATVISTEAEKS